MSCSSWDPLNTTQSTSDWDPLSNTCGIGTQEILADVTEDVYRNSSLGDLGHGITFDAPVDNDLGSAQGIVRPSQTDSAVGGFKSSLTGDQPELTASQSISHSNNGSPQYSFGSGYTGGESEAAGFMGLVRFFLPPVAPRSSSSSSRLRRFCPTPPAFVIGGAPSCSHSSISRSMLISVTYVGKV
ncbi:hypothetical protein Vretifemale_20381, partial [Volvox reticuliferus]